MYKPMVNRGNAVKSSSCPPVAPGTQRQPGDESSVPTAFGPIDAREFRRCLGHYATGVSIMTGRQGDNLYGMTVNSFASLSLEPPLILWSVKKTSASAPFFTTAEHFAVNVLSASQAEISSRFGSSHADKFDGVPWRSGATDTPLIEGCIAYLECSRDAVHDGGDHYIIVGKVEALNVCGGSPLVFFQGAYATVQDMPAAFNSAPHTEAAVFVPETDRTRFMGALSAAAYRVSTSFEKHRSSLGLDLGTARVLRQVGRGVCTLNELNDRTSLEPTTIRDAVDLCKTRGYLQVDNNQRLQLTEKGADKLRRLGELACIFAESALAGIDEGQVREATELLESLATY